MLLIMPPALLSGAAGVTGTWHANKDRLYGPTDNGGRVSPPQEIKSGEMD